jgi:hypothetical protein
MTFSRLRPLALAALAFAVAACDQGRTNPPDATVRVVNVAPGFSAITFARGTTDPLALQNLGFAAGSETSYDADTYTFRVFVHNLSTGATSERKSIPKTVVAGTLYTFVLAQLGTELQEIILEAQPPAATASDAQVLAVHAAEGLPAMDIFLEPPGADIAGAVPWGNVAFLGTLAARSVAAADYQITLTAAGNPADVLFTSSTFTLGAASSTAFAITREGGTGTSPISITVAASASGTLADSNAQAAVRVLNAAADAAPRDVALNAQFMPPLFPAVPFAAPTTYVATAPGTDIPVQVTPPGNPGVLELDQKISPLATRLHTLMFLGGAGALTHTFVTDDGRRIVGEARLRFYNAATQFTAGLDLAILAQGATPTTTTTAEAFTTLAPGSISLPLTDVSPGTYDMFLLLTGTPTIAAGPIPITVVGEGIYGVLATNGADSATAAVTLIDDFQ